MGVTRPARYGGPMRVIGLTAPVFGACCYVLVGDEGRCVVIDVGGGAADRLLEVLDEQGLTVAGLLATHGHADHVWDSARVAQAGGVPLTLHERDRYRLTDLVGSLGEVGEEMARQLVGIGQDPEGFALPEVATFGTGDGERTPDEVLDFGGVRVTARHAPGHTEGSTFYIAEDDERTIVFTGDVLFAGTIGRTDFSGGDMGVMTRTLREVVPTLPGDAVIAPGHGPASRVDVELATNPYLTGA